MSAPNSTIEKRIHIKNVRPWISNSSDDEDTVSSTVPRKLSSSDKQHFDDLAPAKRLRKSARKSELQAHLDAVTRERDALRLELSKRDAELKEVTEKHASADQSNRQSIRALQSYIDLMLRDFSNQLVAPTKVVARMLLRIATLAHCNDLLSLRLHAQYKLALKRLDIECCIGAACSIEDKEKLPVFVRMTNCGHYICTEDYASLCANGEPSVCASADCAESVQIKCPKCRLLSASVTSAPQCIYPVHFETPSFADFTDLAPHLHPQSLPALRYAVHITSNDKIYDTPADAVADVAMRIASLETLARHCGVVAKNQDSLVELKSVIARFARHSAIGQTTNNDMLNTFFSHDKCVSALTLPSVGGSNSEDNELFDFWTAARVLRFLGTSLCRASSVQFS